MFFKKDNRTGKIDTIIGPLVEIKGTINSKDTIRIDGVIEGDVASESEVILGRDGKVRGNIKAKNILIGGLIEGNVEADEKIKMLESGQLVGNIKAPVVIIDEGAVFTGNSKMAVRTKSKVVPTISNFEQKQSAKPQ